MKGTIKLNKEFRFAYRRGKKYVSSFVVMHHYSNKLQTNKLGITVSTSVGKAVVRNRLKRYVRESYNLYKSDVIIGQNIVFVVRNRAKDATFEDIKKDVFKCLDDAGILN